MKIVVFAMLIGGWPHLAHAQITAKELTGTWQAQSGGQQAWYVIFRSEGSGIAGMVSSCGSSPGGVVAVQIHDARISENTVHFKCKSGEDGRVITFEGRYKPGEIEFSYEQHARNGVALSALTADRAGMFGPTAAARFVAKPAQEAGVEVAGAINLPGKNVKVEGELFVPPQVGRIRSVLVLVNSGTGWDGMAASLYRDPAMRALSKEIESTLLLLRISNVSQTAFLNVIANASAGADEGVLKLLDRLATESGRGELRNAPVVVWGHSRSSNFAATFAAAHPERTVAFVRYHGDGGPLSANLAVLSRVPALLLCAGRDPIMGTEAAESAWKEARALGAPWTFGIEPDATHQDPADLKTANALLIPWLRAVISQRVPPRGDALQPIPEGMAWLGNHMSGAIGPSGTFPGPKAEASWLPDEASTHGWQVVLQRGRK